MNPVFRSLSLLTPYDVDKPKIRLGPQGDGGYVFVNDLAPGQTVLSYGIGAEYRFDSEMARRGHRVLMFDHTIDGVVADHPGMTWFKEGVGSAVDRGAGLATIEDHLERHRVEGSDLILKMDVEGAEWGALAATSDAVLARFSQIVVEVHQLNRLGDVEFRQGFDRAITRLNSQFTLFHVHANNYDGPNGIRIVGGLPVSNLLELSYVRTTKVERRRSRTLYPTALDHPNVDKKDKLLWFYPFLPTDLEPSDFEACERRVRERRRRVSA